MVAMISRRTVVAGISATPILSVIAPVSASERPGLASGFERPPASRPVVSPDPNSVFHCPMRDSPVRWCALHTFNPAAAVKDGAIYLLFRAEDDSGAMHIAGHTSRLGLARSTDGIAFDVLPSPVLFPDKDDQRAFEWDGGCEDPRLAVSEDGRFVCTYTQFNRETTRLGLASSRDLVFWNKHGSAFADTPYESQRTKSAAIVHRLIDGRMVAARINGRYWMLFGEGIIHAAHSADLIRWTPVEASPGELKVVMAPRPGRFDSALVEGGPPPVLTENGIVMFYNGKNAAVGGDPGVPPLTYCAGRALLDPGDPTRVLSRDDRPFFAPSLPWERSGQYAAGTTFIEGLVHFGGAWLIYYGAADSYVGVARAATLFA